LANKHRKANQQESGKIRVRDKAEEALQHSEQKYRTILENVVESPHIQAEILKKPRHFL